MYNLGSGDWIGLQEAAKICSEALESEKSQDDVFKMGYIQYLNTTACLKIYSFPRESIIVLPFDLEEAVKGNNSPSSIRGERLHAVRAYGPGEIFELHPDILERLLSLRILPSDYWLYSTVIKAKSTEELPGWEHIDAVDDGIAAHWSKTFDGAISPKIEIVWNDLRVDRQELLERLEEIKQVRTPGHSGMGVPTAKADKALSSNERNTLLVIIAAVCEKAGIKPSDRSAAGAISGLVDQLGCSLSDDTVRAKLKLIDDAVGRTKLPTAGK